MSSSVATINNVSRQLFLYGGSFISIVGIIGSCATICLFTRSRYHRVPCSIFMLTGAIFDLIILCFALLLYRIINQILHIRARANIRLLAAQQRASRIEQQLTSMVLLQAFGAACLIPYTINVVYTTATKSVTKSEYQIAIENLITQIVTLGFYAHYSSGFYIYFVASPDVRQSVQSIWHIIQRKLTIANRIAPTTVQPPTRGP